MWFIMAVNAAAFWGPFWFFRDDTLLLQYGKAFAIGTGTSILCTLLFWKQVKKYHKDAFAQMMELMNPSRKRK